MTKFPCYESQATRFEASSTPPLISGAGYTGINTGDGWHIVRRVPIIAEIPKGEHGAPYDVNETHLSKFYATMREWYTKGFKGTLAYGHNDNFGLTHPNFMGYFVPVDLARYEFPNGDKKLAIFADFKIKNDWYAKFKNAELPYHSPEIYPQSWEEHRIDIVSFLDTKPPFFKFAINTIAKEESDGAAKFDLSGGCDMNPEEFVKKLLSGEIKLTDDQLSAFAEANPLLKKAKAKDGSDGTGGAYAYEMDDEDKETDKKYPGVSKMMSKMMGKAMSKMSAERTPTLGAGATKLDAASLPGASKPTALPAEPGKAIGGAMSLDPELAAKFALQANEIAELKAKFSLQENEKKASTFVEKAEKTLVNKIVSPALKEQIASFAIESAKDEKGEEKFSKFVDAIKSGLRDKPTTLSTTFGSAQVQGDLSDPVVAKFAAAGENPEALERIAQFSAEWNQMHESWGEKFTCKQEDYIKNELSLWKADPVGYRKSQVRR